MRGIENPRRRRFLRGLLSGGGLALSAGSFSESVWAQSSASLISGDRAAHRSQKIAGTWERRLGLIVPSWNSVNEYEFHRVVGPTISVHAMRIKITDDDEKNYTWMETQVPAASQLLEQAKVHVICYGCMAGGFVKGPGHDQQIVKDIEAATGIPGVAAAAAVVDALRALKVNRVSVASPYQPWLNEKLQDYLNGYGIEVLAYKGFGSEAHASFTPQQNAALAAEVDRPQSQAIFISCSDFRTLEIIEPLEAELGKPVVTSNMSALWKMLRVLDDRRSLPGAGRLFREA